MVSLTKDLTRQQAADLIAAALASAGFDQPRREARWLLEAALELSPGAVLLDPDLPVGNGAARLTQITTRRLRHEPLSRILGLRDFCGMEFNLVSATLDPRPDTEVLVQAAHDHARRLGLDRRPSRIIDLGTGSGAILCALLKAWPLATGLGTDLSQDALVAAEANTLRLCGGARARFLQSNWLGAVAGRFDIIISNPPYIPTSAIAGLGPEVRNFDPVLALDGGEDGLDAYRVLAKQVPERLAECGFLAVEVGIEQADAVSTLFAEAGLKTVEVRRDLSGIQRVVVAESAE